MSDFNSIVNTNFSRRASTYLDNAFIQRSAALTILNKIDDFYHNGLILDLGSGPGTFSYQDQTNFYKDLILFDLSTMMLKEATSGAKVNGNAESLPFADMTFDLVISSLMLQWPRNKPKVVQEIYRVTKPGAYSIITVLIKPSLYELQQAWSLVDNKTHTLDFLECSFYRQLFTNSGFKEVSWLTWHETCYFADLQQLLNHFKLTGTNLPQSLHSKHIYTKNH